MCVIKSTNKNNVDREHMWELMEAAKVMRVFTGSSAVERNVQIEVAT